jgi:malate dehydrogenase (oxaloacetate-decarboxylating)
MLTAAAKAVGLAAAANGDGALLPPVTRCRAVARDVAHAVAREAVAQGLADALTDDEIAERIEAVSWYPHYRELG